MDTKCICRSWAAYWGITLAALAGAVAMAIWYAPVEATMGIVQKLFYVHLPCAINTFAASFGVFAASRARIS